jgi:hypothetical protein
MSKKKSFFILFLSLKMLNLQAQAREKIRFKPHFSQTTSMGVAIPIGNLADKNRFGFHSATVVEADVSPHFFARLTWDFFQLRYVETIAIGNQFMDVRSNNIGNAFYLSAGYQKAIKQWKYYGFFGSGLTLFNDPKLETVVVDNVRFTYLSNQNVEGFSLNLGIGVAYKLSFKEQIKIETNFLHLPNLDNSAYLSLQLGYNLYLNNPKNTLFLTK